MDDHGSRPEADSRLREPVATRTSAVTALVQQAYNAWIHHASKCADCRTKGVDCREAVQLRQDWRDAKEASG